MDGRQAAQAVIDDLPKPRRSQMQHLHGVILDALPGIDVRVTDYSGHLIGYGWYAYSNSKGPAAPGMSDAPRVVLESGTKDRRIVAAAIDWPRRDR